MTVKVIKSKERMKNCQTRGDWRNVTKKCNMVSWIRVIEKC